MRHPGGGDALINCKEVDCTDQGARFDVIVLGAGPAGLAAARELDAQSRVLVVDGAEQCGGAHRSRDIGPYTFDQGSFFFERKHPWFDYMPELRDEMVPAKRRSRRIDPRGRIRHYPFDPRELLEWPLTVQLRVASEYVGNTLRSVLGRRDAPRDVAGAVSRLMGRTAFRQTGLEHYVSRFNHLDADRVDVAFFDARMQYLRGKFALPSIIRLLAGSLRPARPAPEAEPNLFVRPRRGFSAIYSALQRDLAARGVDFALDETVRSISRTDDGFAIETDTRSFVTPRVVSTIPIATTHSAAFGRDLPLKSLDLLVLYVSCDLDEHELREIGHVLFNFHTDGAWKRLTVHSRYYDLDTGRSCFSVEVTMKKDAHLDPQDAFEDFRRHVHSIGLMRSGLALEGHDVTENAYPVLSCGSEAIRKRAIKRLEQFGVEPVGRQGRFSYLPTSNQIVRQVRERIRNIRLASNMI